MKITPIMVLTCAAILLSPVLCQIVFATPWTPMEWKENGKLQDWIRDGNRDYVDDLIRDEEGPITIIVDLNHCFDKESEIVNSLEKYGTIEYIGEFLSFIIISNVEPSDAQSIAKLPEVAMVELATAGTWTQGNAQAAKIESSGDYSPQTLQDGYGWPGMLNGGGVVIAFADTGISSTTETNLGIPVVGGYNGVTGIVGNPEPDAPPGDNHAEWMASWVFGASGISPGAQLFDIKIGNMASGVDPVAEARALEEIYRNNGVYNINVLALMYGLDITDGSDATSQLLNLVASKGIVIVAGTGENTAGSDVKYPGVASMSIGISAANIEGTVNRNDDSAPFVVGPVQGGAVGRLESLKPELIIPTGEGNTAVSNSIAVAQSAGLCALILQNNIDLRDPDNKAFGSVKDLLLRSAEAKGTPDTTIAYPQSSPTWDSSWGFGEVDAFSAFQYISGAEQTWRTDLSFVGFDGSTHPSTPDYYSRAVETQSERDGNNIQSGVSDKIFALIHNNGPGSAQNIRVNFGFYPWTAGIPKFYDIGSVIIPSLGDGDTTEVSLDWMPPGMPADEDHGCLLVTIDYGFDTNFASGSNFAQKNVRVSDTGSPAVFKFRVENTLSRRALIHLDVSPSDTVWEVLLSDNDFIMDPEDCARIVTAEVNPPDGLDTGTETLFFVTAYAQPKGEQPEEIGGVALKAKKSPIPITIAALSLVAAYFLRGSRRVKQR